MRNVSKNTSGTNVSASAVGGGGGVGKVVKKRVIDAKMKTGCSSMNPSVRLVDIGPVNKFYRTENAQSSLEDNQKNQTTKVKHNSRQGQTRNHKEKMKNNSFRNKEIMSSRDGNAMSIQLPIELQPVVLLSDVMDFFSPGNVISSSPSLSFATKEKKTKTLAGKSPKDMASDGATRILCSGSSSSKLRRNGKLPTGTVETPESLKARGLFDFKLRDIGKEPKYITINIDVITQLLVDAVLLGNARNRHNRPFDLENPRDECYAIVKSLSIYADRVTPIESVGLFASGPTNAISENPLTVLKSGNKEGRRSKQKSWIYLSNLDRGSKYFNKMKRTHMANMFFQEKMISIAQAGMEVDIHNWTLSEVGYILGYWLAKLYNAKGISDKDLPRELILAKENFLELNGYEYDHALVTILPANNKKKFTTTTIE